MTERATDEPRDFQPWRYRAGGRLEARRRQLFVMAAPVFRRHGFHGATIKALAHACGLSPASLYHYFGSKEEMATYLVRRPRMDWDSTWVDPTTDPLIQLAKLLDLSLSELSNYLLALRLADEIAGTALDEASHTARSARVRPSSPGSWRRPLLRCRGQVPRGSRGTHSPPWSARPWSGSIRSRRRRSGTG